MSAKALKVDNVATKVKAKMGSAIGNQLSVIDAAITKVSTSRSNLGAISNRLDHTIANADNMLRISSHQRARSVM